MPRIIFRPCSVFSPRIKDFLAAMATSSLRINPAYHASYPHSYDQLQQTQVSSVTCYYRLLLSTCGEGENKLRFALHTSCDVFQQTQVSSVNFYYCVLLSTCGEGENKLRFALHTRTRACDGQGHGRKLPPPP